MPWTRAIVLVDIDASPFTVISIAAIVLKEENEIKHCAEDQKRDEEVSKRYKTLQRRLKKRRLKKRRSKQTIEEYEIKKLQYKGDGASTRYRYLQWQY